MPMASASCRLARRLATNLVRCPGRFAATEAEVPRPRLIMTPRTNPAKGGDTRVSKQMPWIFRNEVANVEDLRSNSNGSSLLVDVQTNKGRELGIAMCNLTKGGAIGVNIFGRMLTENVAMNIDVDFFKARVSRALEHRRRCGLEDGYRLVNGEGDLLPGVLCDRYGDVLCLQFTALAAEELMREEILDALEAVLSPQAIVLRYDAREDRQLEQASIKMPEVARGQVSGRLECSTSSGFVFTADPLAQAALSAEHHQRLLNLARAQHVEWQRLLEQLTEREVAKTPTNQLLQDRMDPADQAPCCKLSSTSTVQPPEPVEDIQSTFSASDDNRREAETSNNKMFNKDLMEEHDGHSARVGDASPSISFTAPMPPKNKVLRWIQPKLNYIAGTLVVLNTILMFVELELEGRATAKTMGWDTGVDYASVEQYLRWLDGFFDIAFLLELIVRVLCDRSGWRFFLQLSNQLESILVIFGIVDLFVIISHFGERDDAMVLHILRSAHALRALRTCRLFKGLRVLLRACESFISSLFWAMVLLLIFMSAGSILMGNLLQSYLNGDANMDERTWVWEHYGTAYRCWYTMYELTFAGNWPTRARPVTNNVDGRFAIFFFTYITVVSFAMIRVVTAVFLKDTLEAAQNDQELQLLSQLKKKAEYVKKLEVIFETIGDGNGIIKEERLKAVMADPQVRAHLQTLDLDVHEGTALFHLLDNGDGEVTLEEFIDGILRCKGPARAVDQVAMRAEIRQMDMKIMKVLRLISSMPTCGVESPRYGTMMQIDVSTHLMAFSDLRQLAEVD